jgi:hypothetical protein
MNEPCKAKKESSIDKVLESLSIGIGKLKAETLPKFESILGSVLIELEKSSNPEATPAGGRTSLESRLILMNNDVREINEYLKSLQDRIQL